MGTALLADAVGLNQELIGAGAFCGVICKPVVFEGYAEHPLFCLFLPAQIGLARVSSALSRQCFALFRYVYVIIRIAPAFHS